jgi:hypothetical protein
MTDIDSDADLELSAANGTVTVRIPLSEQVTEEWTKCYHRLARSKHVPARADARRDRSWLVVHVASGGIGREVAATMDAARALITEADTAVRVAADTARADVAVRQWWDRNRQGTPWWSASKKTSARTGIAAERRWVLAVTLLVAIVVLALLPPRFSLFPRWVAPVAEAVLLGTIIMVDRKHSERRSEIVRALSYVLVLVLGASATLITGRLVIDIARGGPETNSPVKLLTIGFSVWLYTIIAFAFLYWLLDGGGPGARLRSPREFPDLAFPEQLSHEVTPPGWRPEFFDYLYLGFTNATALSPTDVMPLARWGKLAMAIQAAGSLAILGLVIARAVNILK